ncbi:MAG TPA: hypothetical protein VG796_22175 [Verrucomicrobiales bacterium]|jgi:hypothetical protein|nr:hypothetical protein [Verrucomicrobiales bacterium]
MAATPDEIMKVLNLDQPNYDEAAARLGKGALPILKEVVKTAHPLTASKAAYLAGKIHHEKSVEVLRAAKRRPEGAVRIAAAAAAELLLDHAEKSGAQKAGRVTGARDKILESAGRLVVGLTTDRDADVRRVASWSLPADAAQEKPRTIKAVRKLSKTDSSARLRDSAKAVLNRTKAARQGAGGRGKARQG